MTPHPPRARPLLAVVLAIATCGLVYELLAATLASYVLGNTITQFSLVVGTYLSALGAGSYATRYVRGSAAQAFVLVELATALVGGLSGPLLLLAFAHTGLFRVALHVLVFATGVLVGMEIPLLLRILRDELAFKDLVARVLAWDYLGSLVGSVLFALVLVPRVGLVRTSALCGLVNALAALWSTALLRDALPRPGALRAATAATLALLTTSMLAADRVVALAERGAYACAHLARLARAA